MSARSRRSRSPIRLRLTLAGWVFLAATAMVGVVAVNSGLGMLFVLLGAMLGAMHVSAVLGRRMIAAVQVERELPVRSRQNRVISVGYVLRSIRGGGACLAVRVEEAALKGLSIPPTACGYLPGSGSRLARSEAVASRRGRVAFRAIRLSSTFPFGLVRAARQMERGASLIIWPARGRLTSRLLGRGEAQSAAAAPSIRSGGQDEFYGLREYRPGDSARWIHWRRSAGRKDPVIREMARPRPQTLWVVLDTLLTDDTAAAAARRERAIRLAATLAEEALEAGYRVGAAMAYSSQVLVRAPTDRRAQRARLLDVLAEIDDNRTGRLEEAVARLRAGWLRQAHVVVIALSPPSGAVLSRLRRDCRGLTVVQAERAGELFRDDPAAAGQEAL